MLPQEPPGSRGTRACHASLEHIWMLVGDRLPRGMRRPTDTPAPPPTPAATRSVVGEPTLTGSGISETLSQAQEVNR